MPSTEYTHKGRSPKRIEQLEAKGWLFVHGVGIPPGPFMEWPDAHWDQFDYATQKLEQEDGGPLKCVDIWNAIAQRDKELADAELTDDPQPDEVKVVSVHDLTEQEWQDLASSLEGVAPALPAPPAMESPELVCIDECRGPRHPRFPTYNAHLPHCPRYGLDKDKASLATVGTSPAKGPCNCGGPGSAKEKWPTHLLNCPAYDGPAKPYAQSSHSKKPSCMHEGQEFELEDGLVILASSSSDVGNKLVEGVDLGVYLASSWGYKMGAPSVFATPGVDMTWLTDNEPKYKHAYIQLDWPDRAAPNLSIVDMVSLGETLIAQLGDGETIETGCVGGHGRTGSMLAMLLTLQGVRPVDAINRVWDTYCIQAIESMKQVDFISSVWEVTQGKKVNRTSVEWKEMLERGKFSTSKPAAQTKGKGNKAHKPNPVSSLFKGGKPYQKD